MHEFESSLVGFKREIDSLSFQQQPQGMLANLVHEEYEKGMKNLQQDWRVTELKESLDLKQSELHKLQQTKRALEHELSDSRNAEVIKDTRIKELQLLSNELGKDNQKLKDEIQFLQ